MWDWDLNTELHKHIGPHALSDHSLGNLASRSQLSFLFKDV